jgi:hypothetical protein
VVQLLHPPPKNTMSKIAKKIPNVVVDVEIRADFSPPSIWYLGKIGIDRLNAIKADMEDAIKIVNELKVAKYLQLHVFEKREDQCSCCGSKWEPYVDTAGFTNCANCGADINTKTNE